MLKTLCELNGTSGREDTVRDFLIAHLPKDVSYTVDALGNLIVEKRGAQRAKNKVMLASHMDEVGLIITYITDDGFLRFAAVGGIDARALFGKAVKVGENAISGVIGGKAVHQLTKDEKNTVPEIEDLLIDIGARTKAKAIDDRAGNLVMLEMLQQDLPYDLTFCFTVQEEIGTRGAEAVTDTVAPDYAIVLESTTAADLPDVGGYRQVCKTGGGAVVGFMDRGTVYDKSLFDLAFRLAKENNIPCQTKTMVAGGNDASAIHKAAGGVKTVAVSVPCRYIHSASCVAKKEDIDSVARLSRVLADTLAVL